VLASTLAVRESQRMPVLLLGDLFARHSPRPTRPPRPPTSFSTGPGIPWTVILLFALVIAAVAGIAYLAYWQKKQRRLGFALVARQLGLTYTQDDPYGLLGAPFEMFQKGDGRGVENVIAGTWQGDEVRAFDYWYYEESSDGQGHTSRTYHRFDCAILPMGAACPHLLIGEETFFTRLAGALSFHDIEFENEGFNRAFNVKCEDRKFANDVVDSRMIDWLVANGENAKFEVTGSGALVAIERCDPRELVGLLGLARGFVDHVPKVVFSLYPQPG
jgi:hypothetical protein